MVDTPKNLEIEITPEMIEAGERHLFRYHPDHGLDSEKTVTLVFRAMLEAHSSSPAAERQR